MLALYFTFLSDMRRTESADALISMITFNPLTAGAAYIRVFIFY